MFQKEYWERKSIEKRRSPEHRVIKAYVLPKIEEIRKAVIIDTDTRLLDLGCGNGFFTHYFNPICKAVGADYSKTMLKYNDSKMLVLSDASRISFSDGSFDIVFCHALLHHVDNINKVISEMERVSRRYVIILEPNRNNFLMFLFSLIVREERRALRFSLRFLKRKVEEGGLRIISSFSYGMVVPNKTPLFLLSILNLFNFKFAFGMTNFVIAEKI